MFDIEGIDSSTLLFSIDATYMDDIQNVKSLVL